MQNHDNQDPDATALTVQEALQRAFAAHQEGNLDLAERYYAAILRTQPDHFDALHLLGIAATQRQRPDDAIALLSRAITVNPQSEQAYLTLANVLKAQGRFHEALASCDHALAVNPDSINALNDRGTALHDLRRLDEALASFNRALSIDSEFVVALYNRALVLQDLGHNEEAIASYDAALRLRPQFPEALNNRGRACADLQRFDEAIASWDQALAIRPDFPEALSNRATALQRLEKVAPMLDVDLPSMVVPRTPDDDLRYQEQRLASYESVVAHRPDFAEAWSNRGDALNALHRHEEALASFERAIAIKPDSADLLSNRATALLALGRHAEALASCEAALALVPRLATALNNRGAALSGLGRHQDALASYDGALSSTADFAEALQNRGAELALLGRHEEAVRDLERAVELRPDLPYAQGTLLHSRMHCCDWQALDSAIRDITAHVRAGRQSIAPLAFLAISDSAHDQLLCAREWVADRCPPASATVERRAFAHRDRIRVAYMSGDFRDHPIATLMAGVFETHDRTRFETIALSYGPATGDAMQVRLRNAFDRFVDIREQSDEDVVRLIQALEVDILVDLAGFTGGARTGILALRPAPIQVNYLGYPGTMGADYIDYILADADVIPRKSQPQYAENVVYLPDTFQANDAKRAPVGTASRADFGLPEAGFVFCSFNNNYKITPAWFDVWMRLLRQVDGSVLWLVRGNASSEHNLRREAESRGIAASRLVFAPRIGYAAHLARYRAADLFLDTLPFNGGTTASDALWAGLPVLTCSGDAMSARMAGSLLKAVGLPELVTSSAREYEALALRLATERRLLAEIRQRLEHDRRTSGLFDTGRFCRYLEAAYVEMWGRSRRGAPAQHIVIEPIAAA